MTVANGRLFENLRTYAVYRRALLSYLVLSAVTVTVLTGVLFAAFGGQSVRDITESGEAILEQTASAIDLLYEQVRTVGNALIEAEWVIASLRAEDIDRHREYRTNLVFSTLRTVYPFIRFVGLFNGATDRYVNTEGLTADAEREFLRLVAADNTAEFFASYVRPIDYSYPRATDTGQVVSFVLRPDVRLHRPNESFLIVNVEMDYIRALTENLTRGYGGQAILASNQRQIIAITSGPLSEEAARRAAAGMAVGEESAASARMVLDGVRHVVTGAPIAQLGWRLYGVRPLSQILSHSLAFAGVALGIAAGIVIFGAIAAAMFTNAIYRPLARLVHRVERGDASGVAERAAAGRINEYEVLSQAYQRYALRIGLLEGALDDDRSLLRRSYVHALLTGTRVELPENQEAARRIERDFQAESYAVVLCVIDRLAELRRSRPAEEISHALMAISGATRDALSGLGSTTAVLLDGDEIAVVIGTREVLRVDAIVGRIHEVQLAVGKETGLTLSFGVSGAVHECARLNESLAAARRLIRARFFSGPGSIITPLDKTAPAITFIPLPSDFSRRLVESLRLNRVAEVGAALAEFTAVVRSNSYQGALALYHQLGAELLAAFAHLQAAEGLAFTRHLWFIQDISSVEFAVDADRELGALCETIARIQAADSDDRTLHLYKTAVRFINEHYTEPNLCLDSVAGALHVSAGHLGRVFGKQSDTFLADYVTAVRIEHAKVLLETTDDCVQKVAEQVGVSNGTYFFTLFRKRVGTTPARYRRTARTAQAVAATDGVNGAGGVSHAVRLQED